MTYGDLKPVTVKVDGKEETYPLLSNDRQKTTVMYKIPIVSPKVEQLLERTETVKTKKGKEIREKELFQKIFQPLTNQPTNRYLKEIIKDLKINKTMTFHRARHSNLPFHLKTNNLQICFFLTGNDLETSELPFITLLCMIYKERLQVVNNIAKIILLRKQL